VKQTNDLLLCKDCKHAKWRPWHAISYRCHRDVVPEVIKIDYVTGPIITKKHYDSCFAQRFNGDDKCGPEGKFWEPKHKKHLFLAIKHSER
jgi:hypothetical protein